MHSPKKYFLLLLSSCFISYHVYSQWYLTQPVRYIQTNIPLHKVPDYTAKELVSQIKKIKANTWLFNVGGIYAYYPTKLPFHTVNPYMQKGRDFVGELISEAEKNNIRVMGRFDFSLVTNELAGQHPEWCFKRKDGTQVTFNGLTNTCINSEYYQQRAFDILNEAMGRYKLAGILINWWGNHPTNSYVEQPNGICHCQQCITAWSQTHTDSLPDTFTPEYTNWHNAIRRKLETRILDLLHTYNNNTALVLYHGTGGRNLIDGFTVETRTGNQTNQWWLYEASYYINLYRNSYSDKGVFNTTVNFINFNYRFTPHRMQVNQARILQGMAHGAFPGLYMIGMPNELDTDGAAALYLPNQIHAKNETDYTQQQNNAGVVVIDDGLTDQMKGLLNILSENHIPYKLLANDKTANIPGNTRLIITINSPDDNVLNKVAAGVQLLHIGTSIPKQLQHLVAGKKTATDAFKSYWSIDKPGQFVRSSYHHIIPNIGPYIQLKDDAEAALHLIPPAMTGPPEKVWNDVTTSNIPGIVRQQIEKGRVTWVPWNAAEAYFVHGTTSINDMLMDVLDSLDPKELITNAHPLVETTVMTNDKTGKKYIHLLNHTGQLHGSANKCLTMYNITIQLKGKYLTVKKASNGLPIKNVHYQNGYTSFIVDTLKDYEMIIVK